MFRALRLRQKKKKSVLFFIQKHTHMQTHARTHTFATEKCDVILGKQLILHGEMSTRTLGPLAHFLFYGCFFSISLSFDIFFKHTKLFLFKGQFTL